MEQTINAIIGIAPNTQLRTCVIKIVTFNGGHLMCKSYFPYHQELLLKERIRSLWEQFFFVLREVPISKRDANEENHCLI